MKKYLIGALLATALVVAGIARSPAAPYTVYSGPYFATIQGNGDVGPFPTYGQSVCGFTLSSGTGTLTATVEQSIDGQLFSTLGSPLTGLANGAQYSWSVLPNPPTSQALTSGAAGVSANKITVSSFTGTPMQLVFACTSSPLAVTPSSIGAVASVTSAGSPVVIGGTSTNPTVGCSSPGSTCQLAFQGAAYGVSSASTDNGAALASLFSAACAANSGIGGGPVVQLPAGVLKTTTNPLNIPCSNLQIFGVAGAGYPGGSPTAYPTPIPPATTLQYTGAAGGTILQFAPTNNTEQANNLIKYVAFDCNSDNAAIGLQAQAQLMFDAESLTFEHCSSEDMDLAGISLGSATGSVAHPTIKHILCNNSLAPDGNCIKLEGVTSPTNSNTFMMNGEDIWAYQHTLPCIDFEWSDANQLRNVHCHKSSGSTMTVGILFGCQSVSNEIDSLISDTAPYVDGSTTCGAANGASGTILSHYYNHDNNSPVPVLEPGATGMMTGDFGNIFYFPPNTTDNAFSAWPSIAFGLPASGTWQPAAGVPMVAPDSTLANLMLGVPGTSQSGKILFCPGGCGASATQFQAYQSYIASDGSLSFPSPNASTNYGPAAATIPSLTLSGLPASVTVCLNSSKLASPCPSPNPTTPPALFASTATSATTAPTASPNTYQQIPCGSGSVGCSSGNISITTGVNHAGNGEWLVTFDFPLSNSILTTGEYTYGCASSTSTFTLVDATGPSGGSTCISALSNSFAGTAGFGDNNSIQASGAARGTAHFIVANSTTVTVGCYFAYSAITSQPTIRSSCSMVAVPY